MVHIDKIQFRYFKSFRNIDIDLSRGFVALAGPNGSGKSNICDGIRFALGENSLKSLRAKRVSDLIMQGSDKAEIRLHLKKNGQKVEVRRAIRDDGKTKYRYNGKRMTRTAIMDALRPMGAEVGDHNVIAQGEVEEIVKMSAKERRGIIDSVSGISEFEEKRTEALRELGKVDAKINDASIVMKEREGFLLELEKEKDDAIRYKEINVELERLRGSLIYAEMNRVNEEHTHSLNRFLKLEKKIEDIKNTMEYQKNQIAELEKEKNSIVDEINRRSKKDDAYREIEELRASLKMDASSIEEKNKDVAEIEKRVNTLKKEEKDLKKQASDIEAEMKSLSQDIEKTESKTKELEAIRKESMKNAGDAETKFVENKQKLEKLSTEIEEMALKESRLSSEVSKEEEIKKLKEHELLKLKSASSSDDQKSSKIKNEISGFQSQIKRLSEDADRVFTKERTLNKDIPEIEKKWLKAKERVSELSARIGATAASKGTDAVLQMRDNGEIEGIHGTVAELCSFKSEYAVAIEASAGQRMSYIVVDSADVAAKAIKKLKKTQAGRCTFIPLDRRQDSKGIPAVKVPGSMGPLMNYIEFSSKHKRAFEYVFGATILVNDVDSAKKSTGRVRMVTLDGDIFELSGIITGGLFKPKLFLKEKKELEEWENKASMYKRERENLLSSLESIRTEMADIRKDKAEKEVKLKSLELELDSYNEKKEEQNAAKKEAASLEKEVSKLGERIEALKKELSELNVEINGIREKRTQFRALVEDGEKRSYEKKVSELEKNLSETSSRASSLKATIEGKEREFSLINEHFEDIIQEIKDSVVRRKETESEIKKTKQRMSDNQVKLDENERIMKDIGKAVEKLFAKRNELEKSIEEISVTVGKTQHSYERSMKEMNEIAVNKATYETKLTDLKAEYEKYTNLKPIESNKEDLDTRIKEREQKILELGDVNLRAPELYEERKRDMEEIKLKVGKLAEEKTAVMNVIDEIEGRKKAVFVETFNMVNDNFKRLFVQVFRGEGFLLLDKPSTPFESGLNIKVRDEKNEKYLESMSGGEKSLLTLLFIFSIHMYKPAPFYLLDEVEAALDKENSKKLALLLKKLSANTQFIMVTHNDQVLSTADIALGVTRTKDGSKVVGVQLK